MSDSFFPVNPEPRPFATDFLPRLVLEPAMAATGLYGAVWWPRSCDAVAELPDLITALGAYMGRIRRAALDKPSWERMPRSVAAAAAMVTAAVTGNPTPAVDLFGWDGTASIEY